MNMELMDSEEINDSLWIAFDYANLWTTDFKLQMYGEGDLPEIDFSEFKDELVIGDPQLRHFSKKLSVSDLLENGNTLWVEEVVLDLTGSARKQTLTLDNIRIGDFSLDFDLPDGSTMEELFINRHAGWEPYKEGKDFRTKLMLHGMTDAPVQDLVPLAKSWTEPAELKLKGTAYESLGYDPTQMAYVLEQSGETQKVLEMTFSASKSSPLVKPAIVIHNWKPKDFDLSMDGKILVEGRDYQSGMVRQLDGNDLVLWLDFTSNKGVDLKLTPRNQSQALP
jgi:hypothetical protein